MRALRPAQALQEEHAAGARIAQPSRLGGKKKTHQCAGACYLRRRQRLADVYNVSTAV